MATTIQDEDGKRWRIQRSEAGAMWEEDTYHLVPELTALFEAVTTPNNRKPTVTYHRDGKPDVTWRAIPLGRFYVHGSDVFDRARGDMYASLATHEDAQELADLLSESADRVGV